MRPVLFHLPEFLGGAAVPTYGVIMVLGAVVGLLVWTELVHRSGYARKQAAEAALETIVVAIVASKLIGLMFQPRLGDLPLWKLFVFTGGVWYVGFLAGVAYAAWKAWRLRMTVWFVLDRAAAAVAIGHGIGRLACLFAGCCYGAECDLPWAVTFTREGSQGPLGVPLHPTALYESAGELAIGAALIVLIVRRAHRFHGLPSLLYLIGYGALRFVVEIFRADDRGAVGPLSTSQAIALVIIAVAVPALAWGWRRGRLNPFKPPLPEGDVAGEPAVTAPPADGPPRPAPTPPNRKPKARRRR